VCPAEGRSPVTVIPVRPTFPPFKIVGIERIAPVLFRALGSHAVVRGHRTPPG